MLHCDATFDEIVGPLVRPLTPERRLVLSRLEDRS